MSTRTVRVVGSSGAFSSSSSSSSSSLLFDGHCFLLIIAVLTFLSHVPVVSVASVGVAGELSRSVVSLMTSQQQKRKKNDNDNDNKESDTTNNNDSNTKNEICIIFSDLDGTLIHYPDNNNNDNDTNGNKRKQQQKMSKGNTDGLLYLPKSSSGLSGVISSNTLCQIRDIRTTNTAGSSSYGGGERDDDHSSEEKNTTSSNRNTIKFVLISGMRTSTFLQRLPYLPKADAYCTENGGRIFYPITSSSIPLTTTTDTTTTPTTTTTIDTKDDNDAIFWVKPKRYKGQTKDDRKPFGIREDMNWRQQMIEAMGGDSFGSYTLNQIANDPSQAQTQLHERDGVLWDFARDLIHNKKIKLDTKGYTTCFRVNRKHQQEQECTDDDDDQSNTSSLPYFQFDDVSNGKLLQQWNSINHHTDDEQGHNHDGHQYQSNHKIGISIDWSVNLNCVDFYPSMSGKKNCCLYLSSKFFPERCGGSRRSPTNDIDIDVNNNDDTTLLAKTKKAVVAAAAAAVVVHEVAAAETAKAKQIMFLSNHVLCLCDDDNDLEMALACHHAYLPDISSQSMMDTVQKYPTHFTIPFINTIANDTTATTTTTTTTTMTMTTTSLHDDNFNGDNDTINDSHSIAVQKGTPDATELALSMILKRLGVQ